MSTRRAMGAVMRRRIEVLKKRLAFLELRIAEATLNGKDLSFDKAEAAALGWVIPLAEAEIERHAGALEVF